MHPIGTQPTVEKTDHASQRDWTGFSPRYSIGQAAVALKNPSNDTPYYSHRTIIMPEFMTS